jgi:hypothetical protein
MIKMKKLITRERRSLTVFALALIFIVIIANIITWVIAANIFSASIVVNPVYLVIFFIFIVIELFMLIASRKQITIKTEDNYNPNADETFSRNYETLALPSGTVRGFMILILIVVVIVYLYENWQIPIHFLVAFNIVLLFYEIKPKEVLPKRFIVEIPETYGAIERIPVVNDTIELVIRKLEGIQKECEGLIAVGNKTSNVAKKRAEDVEKRIYKFLDLVQSFEIKKKSIIEQIAVMGLLIIIGVFSLVFIEGSSELFNALTIALASFIAVISIAFGVNFQSIMVRILQPKLKGVFDYIDEAIDATKVYLTNTVNQVDNILTDVTNSLTEFKKKNILVFLPKDIVAWISINIMIYICGVVLLLPAFEINEFILIGMEFVFGYYFLTKK